MSVEIQENAIKEVAMNYKRILGKLVREGKEKMFLDVLEDSNFYSQETMNVLSLSKQTIGSDERYLIHIHFCLSLLDKEEKEIIWKEFFLKEHKGKKYEWWSYNYARSTYYRLRTRAIKKFYSVCCN